DHYRDDERVMAVLGENCRAAREAGKRGECSYYFSKYFRCWGWAGWARAWRKVDLSLSRWPAFRDSGGLESSHQNREERRFWRDWFDREYQRKVKRWDICYILACWEQSGLNILPRVNLISNLGFHPGGSHCMSPYHW